MIDHLNGLDYVFMALCVCLFGGTIWHIWRGKPYCEVHHSKADFARAVRDRSDQPLHGPRH
jgi:hypothetical protein